MDNEKEVTKPAPAPAMQPAAPSSSTNGLAIASLVTGILAFLCGLFFMGLVFGAAAVVLGVVGLKRPGGRGLAIAGITTGIVGAVSGAVFTVFWVIALMGVSIGAGTVATQLDKANDAIAAQNQSIKDQIAAKKDFLKDETAVFGDFELKVNSVTRNYVPDETYSRASAGKELIIVNVSVKNISSDSQYFTNYDLGINENGITNDASYVEASPSFDGGNISSGATAEGNIVYEVTKDASVLKLQYETIVYDAEVYTSKTLVYTLAV